MKLWYQGMARQEGWNAYNKALKKIINQIKDPDTEIEIHGIEKTGGVGTNYRYLEFLETAEVLENLQIAIKRGFHAFLIGNIADPGIREGREIANFPVLGLCETSLHTACMMGASFSFVTINEKFTPRILENVRRYGFTERLAAVNPMKIDRTFDLDKGFTDARMRKKIITQFMKAANANVEQGAEVVIAAGGVPMAMLTHAGVHEASKSTPILNGIIALVKMGEMAVKMQRIMGGRFTSKRLSYAPPGLDRIAEFRKYYGDVYPTLK